jgi:hypothetical protein
MFPNEGSGMNHRVSAFAVAVAGYVRPLGLQRMGFSCSVLLVWWRYGREFLPLHGLGAIPRYVLQKFSIYVKFFFDVRLDHPLSSTRHAAPQPRQ